MLGKGEDLQRITPVGPRSPDSGTKPMVINVDIDIKRGAALPQNVNNIRVISVSPVSNQNLINRLIDRRKETQFTR
jgi:hypothetical protein